MFARPGALRLFITAGEASGDQLGAALMRDIRQLRPETVFIGIGGPLMLAEGLTPIFPMEEIAVMGFVPVIRRLPSLLARIRDTADAVRDAAPDALILIDAQDFSRRVAERVRSAAPQVPIIGYVAPTVWAWRPGRARRLKPLLDHLLAVLPFEPEAMDRLGGPPTSYVGHPLLARLEAFEPVGAERHDDILLLPGSRRSEIERLLPVFGKAAGLIAARAPKSRFVLPAVPHLLPMIEAGTTGWPAPPRLVTGEDAKWRAFFGARAALAASGTVTLELALAGVPMVVGYKVAAAEAAIVKRLLTIATPVLPDIIMGTHQIPALLQQHCTPEALAEALLPLLEDGPARHGQAALFAALRVRMETGLTNEKGRSMAARIALEFAEKGR